MIKHACTKDFVIKFCQSLNKCNYNLAQSLFDLLHMYTSCLLEYSCSDLVMVFLSYSNFKKIALNFNTKILCQNKNSHIS